MTMLVPLYTDALGYDVTYRKHFENESEYRCWRKHQFFEDYEIRWRMNLTYENGSMWMLICTSDDCCPEVFDQIERLFRKHAKHEAC